MNMVWERLGFSGGELLLALALADWSHDDGGSIFPSVGRLAIKSRQSSRTVRRQLAKFRAIRWLVVVEAGGLRGSKRMATRYQINPLWMTGVSLSGVPEVTPVTVTGVMKEMATGGTRPLTPVTATPDIAVSAYPSGTIRDPKSAGARASPPGSRAAHPVGVGERPVEERLAAARSLLASVADYPLEQIAKIYKLSDSELALVTAPSATYAGAT